MCPQYLWIDTPHAYGRTTLKFRFLMGIFKFSDPPYGGSNEVFGKNQNFPLVLNIKLHLKMSVNYQLQISPPPKKRQNQSANAMDVTLLCLLFGTFSFRKMKICSDNQGLDNLTKMYVKGKSKSD